MGRTIVHEMAGPTSPRRAHWQTVLAEWRQSGLSQAEFCRRRGILPGTLAFWKHTLTRGSAPAGRPVRPGRAAPPTFVPVRVIGAPPARRPGVAELVIRLRGDRQVRVRGPVAVPWLGQVVRMLEALGC